MFVMMDVVAMSRVLGEVKKTTCFASPPASFLEAAWIFILFFNLQKKEEKK